MKVQKLRRKFRRCLGGIVFLSQQCSWLQLLLGISINKSFKKFLVDFNKRKLPKIHFNLFSQVPVLAIEMVFCGDNLLYSVGKKALDKKPPCCNIYHFKRIRKLQHSTKPRKLFSLKWWSRSDEKYWKLKQWEKREQGKKIYCGYQKENVDFFIISSKVFKKYLQAKCKKHHGTVAKFNQV